MQFTDTEKKLVARIRTRLANRKYTGFSNQELRDALSRHYQGSLDTISDSEVSYIVDQIITERNQNTPIEQYPADSGVIETVHTPPESLQSIIEDHDDPDMIGMLSTVDPKAMVRQQADNMGITISDSEITDIANQVQNTESYNQDQVSAIKNALIEFIDWQHQQATQRFDSAIAEVSNHAASRQAEFNNRMTTGLNEFFRSSQQNSQNNFGTVLGALQSYREIT